MDAKHASWQFIIITEGGDVSGTMDRQEALNMASEGCIVIEVDYAQGTVAQLDSDGDNLDIGSL